MKSSTTQFATTFAALIGFGEGSSRGRRSGMTGSSLLLAGWCRAWMNAISMWMTHILISTNPMPVTVLAGGVTWPIAHTSGVYQAKHATRRVA